MDLLEELRLIDYVNAHVRAVLELERQRREIDRILLARVPKPAERG